MAFLYSDPSISMLSIILTARILGMEMGIARTICAIVFSVIIGMIMAWIYRGELQVQMQHFLKKMRSKYFAPQIQPESFHHLICGLAIEELSRDFIHPTSSR